MNPSASSNHPPPPPRHDNDADDNPQMQQLLHAAMDMTDVINRHLSIHLQEQHQKNQNEKLKNQNQQSREAEIMTSTFSSQPDALVQAIQQHNRQGSIFGMPGLKEGLAAGFMTVLALTPVRSMLLKQCRQRNWNLGQLPDLILTTTQIMVSAHVALYTGSLRGSYWYLHVLSQVPVTALSPTATAICHDEYTQRLLQWRRQKEQQQQRQSESFVSKSLNNHGGTESSSSSSSWDPRVAVLHEFQKALETCRQRNEWNQQQQQQDQQ